MPQANTTLPTDRVGILAVIDPDAYTAAVYTSAWVRARYFGRLKATVFAGDLGTSATLDFAVHSSASSNGASPTVVGSITQLTQAGTDSNKQAIINVECDKLTEGHEYVAIVMTVGTATSDAGAVLEGFDPRYAPASDIDASTVDEIVSV